MNIRTRNVYFLLAASTALLLSSCTAGERRSVTVKQSWPAGAIQRLEVNEVTGDISVEAGPPGEITLIAHVRGHEVELNDKKKTYFDTALSGDTLSIGRERGKRRHHVNIPFFFGGDDLQVDYELRVPPTVDLEITTVTGRIATRGMKSKADCVTVTGPIDVEMSGNHELNARTVNGRVRAKFLQTFQGAQLKTVNGEVQAVLPQTASFHVDLSQVNGDFEASFPLSIHSHPGSRRVSGEVNGGQFELKISTVNGDVEVTKLQ
ncbi:MAG TPA: DUF4097 family beta strand repeat-containing protein [Thermoanaerobaculia bacterium]|nr:DUF4097 family beta strand repeat-containing protein [Thermoanaerobaculia bacterium]